jgi:hypothetical protein
MPATENDRRNIQQPTLERPSMPDHDRTRDPGMHSVMPENLEDEETIALLNSDEDEIAPPDQEFGQMLESGMKANNGRIPEDPNNWLTSEPDKGSKDHDPESRGESLPDVQERETNNDR